MIANCSGTGTVISEGYDAMGGGVAGCLESMKSITGCSADVTIRAGKNAHGIGGLCGFSGTFDLSAPALVSGCTVNAHSGHGKCLLNSRLLCDSNHHRYGHAGGNCRPCRGLHDQKL